MISCIHTENCCCQLCQATCVVCIRDLLECASPACAICPEFYFFVFACVCSPCVLTSLFYQTSHRDLCAVLEEAKSHALRSAQTTKIRGCKISHHSQC